jgi:hypothetical protein
MKTLSLGRMEIAGPGRESGAEQGRREEEWRSEEGGGEV